MASFVEQEATQITVGKDHSVDSHITDALPMDSQLDTLEFVTAAAVAAFATPWELPFYNQPNDLI